MIKAEGKRNRTVIIQMLETWPTGCGKWYSNRVWKGRDRYNIRHLLRQLLPIDTEIGGAGQLTSEAEAVAEHESGNVD